MEPTHPQRIHLAIGRIFRLASRPAQPGDIEDYERCRAMVMAHTASDMKDHRPNYPRDYRKGAQGD